MKSNTQFFEKTASKSDVVLFEIVSFAIPFALCLAFGAIGLASPGHWADSAGSDLLMRVPPVTALTGSMLCLYSSLIVRSWNIRRLTFVLVMALVLSATLAFDYARNGNEEVSCSNCAPDGRHRSLYDVD